MSGDWAPADIADYDQALRGADAELDRLAEVLRTGTREAGERQALASLAALVASRNDPAGVAGLLMAALRRIASTGDPK